MANGRSDGGQHAHLQFALGKALLETAKQRRDRVELDDLARTYALALAERVGRFPQASPVQSLGEQDFLSICSAEAEPSLRAGAPTDALLHAARRSMPAMVMQKFHNLLGGTYLPHRFYELGEGADKGAVILSPELSQLAHEDRGLLAPALEARWSIVEASFTTGIGPVLRSQGLRVNEDALVSPVRRVAVSGVKESICGFQHGRCFYCHEPLDHLGEAVAVDHVYPYSLMNTGAWSGPNRNETWSLVLAHRSRNGRKSNRLPTPDEVERLIAGNEAIIASPHPLRRTLEVLMRGRSGGGMSTPAHRLDFIRSVDAVATLG